MNLSAGRNLTQKDDKLYNVTPEQIFEAIKKPKPEIAEKIKQLRTIQSIAPEQYRKLKVHLPYIVAAQFNPPTRLIAHFASTKAFILDIDHLEMYGKELDVLKKELSADPRVMLMFISPGGNGLKVMLELAEKCYDSAKFSLFYKVFAEKFALQFGMEKYIDKGTSDVTRACFISYDEDAFYNPNAIPIILADYIDFEQLEETRKIEKKWKLDEKVQPKEKVPLVNPIDDEKLLDIKLKLNPNIKLKKEKNIFVPKELDEIVEKVRSKMQENNIISEQILNIHYGKKFMFCLGDKKAEINLFYGKKGFSVVKSPKTGTHGELNEICCSLMCEIFYGTE